jgi:hypothetical protein
MEPNELSNQNAADADKFKKTLRQINNSFNERIKQILSGDLSNKQPLRIGHPSQCLLDSGFSNIPIEISFSKLMEKMNQPNHQFSIVSILHMPECICDPIAIFQSVGKLNTKVVLTEMVDSAGVNLVVAIALDWQIGNCNIHSVRSLYPKDSVNGIYGWIREGLMWYCNKEKALDWVGKQPSNPADVTKLIEGFTNVNIFNKSA